MLLMVEVLLFDDTIEDLMLKENFLFAKFFWVDV